MTARVQLASGATGGYASPALRLLPAEALAEHVRLHGRVRREAPCTCGDCLSCEVRSMGRAARAREIDAPRFTLGVSL